MVMDVFLYGAGLKVGYAYRLIGDLGQLDHQTQTTLLDCPLSLRRPRPVPRVPRRLPRRAAHRRLPVPEVGRAAERPRQARRRRRLQRRAERQGGRGRPARHPERRVDRRGARHGRPGPRLADPRRNWASSARRTPRRSGEAREFLHTVRCALHVVSGEPRDTLTAEKQEAVAALLAYPDTPDVPAVETFMRDYYTHAARVRRIARKVIAPLPGQRTAADARPGLRRAAAWSSPTRPPPGRTPPCRCTPPNWRRPTAWTRAARSRTTSADFLRAHPAPADPAYAGRVFTRILTAGRGVADTLDRLEEWGAWPGCCPSSAR